MVAIINMTWRSLNIQVQHVATGNGDIRWLASWTPKRGNQHAANLLLLEYRINS